jgi:hypothetical protein
LLYGCAYTMRWNSLVQNNKNQNINEDHNN